MFRSWIGPILAAIVAIVFFSVETAGVALGASPTTMFWIILFQAAATSFMVALADPTYCGRRIGGLYATTLCVGALVMNAVKLFTDADAILFGFTCVLVALTTYAVRRTRFRQRSIRTVMGQH